MKRAYSLVVGALLISLFVYVFYRTDKTVINEFIKIVIAPDTFSRWQINVSNTIPLYDIIIFSLPGGLWVFCTTLLSRDLFVQIGIHKISMAIVPVAFAVGLECCQLFQITHGTFDRWDVVSYTLLWILGNYCLRDRVRNEHVLSPFTVKGFICLACFISVYLAHVNR